MFDLAAALRGRYPDARPGVDYVLEKPADGPLRLASWNAVTLGALPQDLLDEQAKVAEALAAKERRESAIAAAFPLERVVAALAEVEGGGALLTALKADLADLNAKHPDPDAA